MTNGFPLVLSRIAEAKQTTQQNIQLLERQKRELQSQAVVGRFIPREKRVVELPRERQRLVAIEKARGQTAEQRKKLEELKKQEIEVQQLRAQGYTTRTTETGETVFVKEQAPTRPREQSVVTWVTSKGKVEVTSTGVEHEGRVVEDLRKQGFQILRVDRVPGTEVAMTVTKQIKAIDVEAIKAEEIMAYKETAIVPSDIKSQVTVPPEIKAAKASKEYIQLSYEMGLGLKTKEQATEEFNIILAKKVAALPDIRTETTEGITEPEWYKRYALFGEEEKKWHELKKPDWDIKIKEEEPVIVTPETDISQLYKVMGKEYEKTVGGDVGRAARKASITFASLFRPETWIGFLKGYTKGIGKGYTVAIGTGIVEAEKKITRWEYSLIKDYVRTGKTIELFAAVQTPAYATVILPLAGGAIAKPALGALGIIGTKVGGFTGKVIAKALPTYFGVTVPVIVGADIGYTAAIHKDEALGGWGSEAAMAKILGYGTQFTMFGLGAKYSPLRTEQFLAVGGKIKTGALRYTGTTPEMIKQLQTIPARYKVGVRRVPGLKQILPKTAAFKTYHTDIRIATSQLKQQVALRLGTEVFYGRTFASRLRSGIGRLKYALKEPTSFEIRQQMGLTVERQPGILQRRDYITSREQLYGGTARGRYEFSRYMSDISKRVPSKYDLYKEHLISQKELRLKLDLLRKIRIETKTQIVVHPEKPYEAIFISTRVDKDIFSIGKIKMAGKKVKITGKTFYKLSPKDVFYQQRPFKSIALAEYLGTVGDYVGMKTTEVSIPYGKAIYKQLYGHTFTEIDIGSKPLVAKAIVSKGATIQKSIVAGETFIKDGFFQQYEHDFSVALSKGAFRGRVTGGIYKDIAVTIKPKIKATPEYYDEPGGFDYSKLSQFVKGDLILPGGIGLETGVKPLPNVYDAYRQLSKTSLMELEWLEEGIMPSKYWPKIGPTISKPAMIPISIATPLSKIAVSQLSTVKTIGLTSISRDLQIQLQIPLVSQDILSKSMQIQLQRSLTVQEMLPKSMQIQLQQPLQKQQQTQLQLQLQLQIQLQQQQLISIPMIIPPAFGKYIFPKIPSLPPTVPTPERYPPEIPLSPPPMPPIIFGLPEGKGAKKLGMIGQPGFYALIKDRVYVSGKKRYKEKFIRLNKRPLSYQDSLSLASSAVDNSAAATFKIIQADEIAQSLRISVTPWNQVIHKFYQKDDRLIEKVDFRIDTEGEIKGISAKGWYARQLKKKPIKEKPIKVMEFPEFDFGMEPIDFNKIFQMPRMM